MKDLPVLGKFLLGEGAEDTPGWLQVRLFVKELLLKNLNTSFSRQFTAQPLHLATS